VRSNSAIACFDQPTILTNENQASPVAAMCDRVSANRDGACVVRLLADTVLKGFGMSGRLASLPAPWLVGIGGRLGHQSRTAVLAALLRGLSMARLRLVCRIADIARLFGSGWL
jgi:hypothetical protein